MAGSWTCDFQVPQSAALPLSHRQPTLISKKKKTINMLYLSSMNTLYFQRYGTLLTMKALLWQAERMRLKMRQKTVPDSSFLNAFSFTMKSFIKKIVEYVFCKKHRVLNRICMFCSLASHIAETQTVMNRFAPNSQRSCRKLKTFYFRLRMQTWQPFWTFTCTTSLKNP